MRMVWWAAALPSEDNDILSSSLWQHMIMLRSSPPNNRRLPACRNWTRISNHYIRSVYMAGSSTAFAVGQLSSQYSPLNADSLLR